MKKILLLICLAPIAMQSQPEIPNGNFETWDYYNSWSLEPEWWTTFNGQLMVPVVPDSNAYESNLAMRVNVLPGFEGGVQQEASTLISVAEDLPTTLQFAVKANVPDDVEEDRVEVIVEYLNEDAIVYIQMWQSFESIEQWQLVTLPLDDVEIPVDEIRLIVSAGFTSGFFGGSWDTWISVDAMAFTITDNVGNVADGNFSIFPNPVEAVLNISMEQPSELICIKDAMGRLIVEVPFMTELDVSSLTPGCYIMAAGNHCSRFIKL